MFDNAVIKNPRTTNKAIYIDLDIVCDGELYPYTATATDTEAYSVVLYHRALAGDFGGISILDRDFVGENEAIKNERLREADRQIAPLSDAVELNIATDSEKETLTAWRTYRVLLNRIDTSAAETSWPPIPA